MENEESTMSNQFEPGFEYDENFKGELRRLWMTEIQGYFLSEKEFLLKNAQKIGYDVKDVARILREHQMLESLVWKDGDETLREFSDLLLAHLRFKQELFSKRIKAVLDETDEKPKASPLDLGQNSLN
jgi:hypothetical protein